MNKAELKKVMGENLRRAREANGLTMHELALQMEITPGYLGLIERGKRGLTAYMILKISQLFSVSVNSFFEDGTQKGVRPAGTGSMFSDKDGLVCFMPIIVYPRRYMNELKEEIERLKQDAAVNENQAFGLLSEIFSQYERESAEPETFFDDEDDDTDEDEDEDEE